MKKISFCFLILLGLLLTEGTPTSQAQGSRRDQLEGLVYEVEDWTEPKDSLLLNKPGEKNWQIWTKEADVVKKRSGGASVTTPVLPDEDRQSPEDGAPVLHTKITGIPTGTYRVYMNNTNRPLGLSFNGGKTWEKTTARGEEDFGLYTIQNGTFELWVDDRFASPDSKGWAYYDYIRFVKTDGAPRQTIDNIVQWNRKIYWTTTEPAVPATVVFTPKAVNPDLEKALKPFSVQEPDSGMRNHVIEIPLEEFSSALAAYTVEIRVPINRSGDAISQSVPLDFNAIVEPSAKQTQTLQLPLSVAEPTNTGRQSWPVTSGVPFAQGVLKDIECLHLENSLGKPVKAQFTPTAYWPDQSVQWLTVDFLADTTDPAADGAKLPAVYTLVLEPKKEYNSTLSGTVANVDGFVPVRSEIVLADGRKLSMSGCRYFRNYSPEKDRKGIFCAEGNYTERNQQEDNGLLNGNAILNNSKLTPGFRWKLELFEYDDTDIQRIRWTIGNNLLDKPFTAIKSATVTFSKLFFNPDGNPEVKRDSDLSPFSFHAIQDTLDHAIVERNGKREETSRFDGFVSTGNQAVLFDNFWQTWPKGLSVSRQKGESDGQNKIKCEEENIEHQILPELPAGYGDDPKKNERDNLIQNYFWLKDGAYQFKRGMSISVDIWSASGSRAKSDPNLAEHLKNPLFAVCNPEYYCSTGVFPPVNPVRPGTFDAYEKAFRNSFANLGKGRQKRGEYGWMSFGDWFGERTNNWGNNEYDLSYVAALQFARSGDLNVLNRGIEMARHYSTVDFRKYPTDPNDKERMYIHTFGHVNGFFQPDDPRLAGLSGQASQQVWWFQSESDRSGGHDHQPGNFYIGCLTGDENLLDVGETVCSAQAKWYTPNFNFTIERAAGWPLTNAVYAYRFTNNPFYLNAARIYFEKIQQKQNPETGCFDLPQDQSECDCPDKKEHRGGKAFAVGVLMHGLARYYESEPDPARKEPIKTVLVRCADWLLDYSWNEEKKGFRYKTGCPKYQDTGWYSILVAEGLAYASEISGNPRYRDFLVRTMAGPVQGESGTGLSSGKDFAQKHRQTPHALFWLEKHGVKKLSD